MWVTLRRWQMNGLRNLLKKNESPFISQKFLNFLNFKFNGEPESFFSYLETKKDEWNSLVTFPALLAKKEGFPKHLCFQRNSHTTTQNPFGKEKKCQSCRGRKCVSIYHSTTMCTFFNVALSKSPNRPSKVWVEKKLNNYARGSRLKSHRWCANDWTQLITQELLAHTKARRRRTQWHQCRRCQLSCFCQKALHPPSTYLKSLLVLPKRVKARCIQSRKVVLVEKQ